MLGPGTHFLFLYVPVCIVARMYAYAHVCGRRAEVNVECLFSIALHLVCLQIRSPPEPFQLGWPVSQPPGSVCLLPSPPALQLPTRSTPPGLDVDTRELNSAGSGPLRPPAS